MATMWLTAEQAAGRLGVKAETLYAYVSRGLISSERTPGERRSRYLRADVERLAARQRGGGGRAGGLEIIVESSLTLLDPEGRLYYRGWDVEDAARTSTFEAIASWLWTGDRTPEPITASPELARAVHQVTRGLSGTANVDRVRAVLAAIRTADPLRHDRRPAAVAATGRSIIAAVVASLPLRQEEATADAVAARLWPRLTDRPPSRRDLEVLDATLVLLADHELAASTLAARVAASTWADPYLVVQAGLAALGGPLHGGASEEARALVREVRDEGASAAEAIGARLAGGRLVPGFGHRVYRHRDPRAEVLLDLLSTRRSSPTTRAVAEIVDTMAARELPFPNVDVALAHLAESAGMIEGAGEAIFAVARVVGWLGHAIEEYEHRLRFRPRAVYIGPAPAPAP